VPPVARLLDFGVSKMMPVVGGEKEDDLDLTRTGIVMGTPYYMSPEQARGDRNLDARVDLYACGVIMYEALTSRRPFTAANYNALLLQILTTKPRPARELRPALPSGFDAVLDKSMARAREDRYQSAPEFQRDLQALRDPHNLVTSPPVPVAVADVARQAFAKPKPVPAPNPPAVSDTGPPPPMAQAPRPRIARAPPPRIAQPPPAADPKPRAAWAGVGAELELRRDPDHVLERHAAVGREHAGRSDRAVVPFADGDDGPTRAAARPARQRRGRRRR
jgi:serine/threonine-protein kinase